MANEHKAVRQELRMGWGGGGKVKSARKNLSSAALNSRRVLKQSDGAVSKHFPSSGFESSRGKRKGVERTSGQTYLSLVRQSNHFLREKKDSSRDFPFNHNQTWGMKSNRRIIRIEIYPVPLDGEAFRLILIDRLARFFLSKWYTSFVVY